MLPDRVYRTFGPLAAFALLAACASDDPPPVAEAEPAPTAEAGPEAPPRADSAEATGAPAGPAVAAPVARERNGDGLGLSQDQLVQVFAQNRFDPGAFESMQLGDGRQVLAASYPPSTQRQVLWVAMFGNEEDPHTVRVDYFPGNAQGGEGETVGQAMAGLMTALFPGWSEAGVWPEQAGAQAWQEAVKAAEEGAAEGGGARVPILEGERDGVWLAALGVPPSVVSYVFTTSEACRPSVAAATFYQGYAGCG